ncbi:unnamed protein product [Phytomonas sp. Hart1]|nr:unnamed protein product [Phytomonas sp. Hart1]|eukprot:CCW70453.1 unnamed protein product [Phytomonas sp. isolate Hart1]
MSNELSLDPSKWIAIIENAKVKCLTSVVSAKNVKHILSTATIRSPQRNLLTAIQPFIQVMLNSVSGTSILTSLIKYGTNKTIDAVAKEVSGNYSEYFKFMKPIQSDLLISLGELLDALIYRVDCKGEHRNAILENMKSCDLKNLFGSTLTLVAAGRLFSNDHEFLNLIQDNEKVKSAICQSARTKETKLAALRCCELIIGEDSSRVNQKGTSMIGLLFLFSVFKKSLDNYATRPYVEFIELLTRHSPPHIVSEICELLQQWPDIFELSKKDSYSEVISNILERGSNEESCITFLGVIFKSIDDIDNRLNSTKTVNWRLLAAIERLPSAVSFLEKKISIPIRPRLRAAKVRYESATIPKAEATRKNILEKFRQLRSKDIVKRAREEKKF